MLNSLCFIPVGKLEVILVERIKNLVELIEKELDINDDSVFQIFSRMVIMFLDMFGMVVYIIHDGGDNFQIIIHVLLFVFVEVHFLESLIE